MIGQIVISKAGRDRGTALVTVAETEKTVSLCDGKKRPLQRPKTKNRTHVAVTGVILNAQQYSTNKSLRRALAVYRDAAKR